jgi:Aspartate/tyrosine/aromatic aminotransferase
MSEEAQALKGQYGQEAVFDFSLGNPDLEPPQTFSAALAELAAHPERGSHGYMANAGYPEVREAVARRASSDQGLEIPASHIVMSVGAAGGLNVVLRTILEPGDEVLAFAPYFPEYAFYAANFGASFVPIRSRSDFSPDPKALAAALGPRTACLILNSPNNPTGKIYSRGDLAAVAAVLEEHGRRCGRMPLIVADEPYREIVYRGAVVPSVMAAYAETVVVSSWSKSLSLPGERIGYVAVSPRCDSSEEMAKGLAFSTRVLGFVNAPALIQKAVAAALDERADVASYAERGTILSEGLRSAGYDFPEPEGAFYAFVRAPGGDDIDFAMRLKEDRVIVVPGTGFGCPGYFRVSFCVSKRSIAGALPVFRRAMESRQEARSWAS